MNSLSRTVPILRGHNVHDADVIPDSYIGVFESGAAASGVQAQGLELLRAQGVEITYEYNIGDEFVGFAAKLDEDQLSFATNNVPGLAYLEVDSMMYALQSFPSCSSTQTGATWGIARSDGNRGATSTYSHNPNGGNDVNILIMDTGIACTQQSSQYSGCSHAFCPSGMSNCNGDGHGHGTHVAGTTHSRTYGIAKGPRVAVLNYKVLSDSGSGSTAGIVAGLDHAARSHPGHVANMSLGGGANASLDNAVNAAHNSNVLVVVAAGNGGQANGACNGSPSRAANSLSVGATTSTNARSTFSDQGSCMNIFAPGSSITSTSRTGGTATMSGTSMASPHVAGAGALLSGTSSAKRTALINSGARNVISGVNNQTPNVFLQTC